MMRVLSLGAGVQSTTLALMAAAGEVGPMPDCAIFADTQAEPRAVYDHLAWLRSQGVLPFPVHVVTAGNLYAQIGKQRPKGQGKHMPIPAFIAGPDGKAALANRSCTRDFKIDPIVKEVRRIAGLTRKRAPKTVIVEQWIGISLDEIGRLKPSREPWIVHRWPLIDMRMSRWDCLRWLDAHGFKVPSKSACTFCPYHSNAVWRDMRDNDPEAWAQAIEIDERVRDLWKGRVPSSIYLHRSLKPLAEVEFPEDSQDSLFDDFTPECEGMCGV